MKGKQSSNGQPAQGPLSSVDVPHVREDGKLPHDMWDQNLRVYVPNHPSFIAGTTIRLTLNSAEYGRSHNVSAEEANFPEGRYLFELESSGFPEGNPAVAVMLNYKARHPETGVVSSSPYTFKLIFDKQPPGGNPLAYISFTPEQLQGVYPDDIVDGHLRTNLPPWSGMEVGDTLTPWLGSAAPEEGNSDAGLIPQTQVEIRQGDLGRPVNVLFPQARLEALGDIPQFFGYQLKDSLGNTSAVSPTREIAVNLQTPSIQRPRSKREARPAPQVKRRQGSILPQMSVPNLRPSDGRLPLALIGARIPVIIPSPPVVRPRDYFQLYANGYEDTNKLGILVPVPYPGGGDTTLYIEAADQPQLTPAEYPGVTWSLDYGVVDPVTEQSEIAFKPVRIIFDRYPPGGLPPTPGALSFTPEQLSGITGDDIDPTEDGVIVHIASWFDDDVDDQAELWLGTGPLEADGSYITPLPPAVTNPAGGIDVVFPRAALETFNAGPVYFGYRVTDWVGNVSNLSTTTPINVYLSGLPQDLEAPLIPEAAPYNPEDGSGLPVGTGLLTWDEANPTTTVQIPIYTGVAEDDRIYLKWNGQTSIPPVFVTQDDIDDEPTNGYLLKTELQLDPYVLTDGSADNIGIWYQVSPASGAFSVDSPKQYINVNLTTPGGEDPDPGTPEHENLQPPQLLSSFAGSVPNIIPAEAYTSPANLTIYRAGAIPPGAVIWARSDVISIFWGADHADDPTDITINAGNELRDLVVPIPPAMIAANGSGADIPPYYVITRILSHGNTASARSPTTLLQVTAPGELPGGDAPLVPAFFPEAVDVILPPPAPIYRYQFIQPTVGLRGTTLCIPLAGVANVSKGDFVSVDFVGLEGPDDDDQDDTAPPIPESRISVVDHEINDEDVRLGYFLVPLPYSKTYYICRNLSITNYSIRNSAGLKNAPMQHIIFALNISGGLCRVP